MVTVGVRDLRNRTADVINQAREGKTIVLTSRGEPIAQIVPLSTRRRAYLTPAEVIAMPKADAGMWQDLATLEGDDTDSLGPIQ